MTEEQRDQIIRLAAAWSDTSFARGLDNGNTPALRDADWAAANAFLAYMRELTK